MYGRALLDLVGRANIHAQPGILAPFQIGFVRVAGSDHNDRCGSLADIAAAKRVLR